MVLDCVGREIGRGPELGQWLMGISPSRYFPPSGTAGLALSLVNGKSRVPAPPPMMMARVRWVVPGGRAGACIALMWPQTGFAARKILVPVKPPTASSSRAAKTARDLAQDGTFPKCAALCETEGNIAERDSVGLWRDPSP